MASLNSYGSSVKKNIEEAFKSVEQYAINTADTEDLVAQLVVRLGCWFEDPEPQYDEYLAEANQTHLENAYRVLRNIDRQARISRDATK